MSNDELNGAGPEPARRVPVLPTLITLGSTLCGFGSICLAARPGATDPERVDWLVWSAWLIFLAMVFDALDGRVARLTKQTSDFGGHLDSLSDVISFGLAPAFLAWQVIKFTYNFPIDKLSSLPIDWLDRVIWLICALYVVCAALRLARFDVSNRHEESAHRAFVGLPTPPAAGMVASLVILYGLCASPESNSIWPSIIGSWTIPPSIIGKYLLPLAVLLLGPLMMSKLRYSHLMHELFKNRRSFPFFFWMILVLFAIVALGWYALPLVFALYVLSGVAGLALDKILDRFDVSQDRESIFK